MREFYSSWIFFADTVGNVRPIDWVGVRSLDNRNAVYIFDSPTAELDDRDVIARKVAELHEVGNGYFF